MANNEPPAPRAELRMVVSRTRPAGEAVAVAKALGAVLVPMESAAAKAVAQAAGLHASRIDGSLLAYNCADTYLPDLLICRKTHAAMVLAAVRSYTAPNLSRTD